MTSYGNLSNNGNLRVDPSTLLIRDPFSFDNLLFPRYQLLHENCHFYRHFHSCQNKPSFFELV